MDGYHEVNGRGWEMVPASAAGPTTITSFSEEFSVFPPRLHEGLPPTLTLTLDPPSDGFEEHKHEEKEEEVVAHVTSTRISKSARRLVDLGIKLIRSKFSNVGGGGGGAFWSFAAVAGLAGVLMYARRRHRRERELLLLLLLEKDQEDVCEDLAKKSRETGHFCEERLLGGSKNRSGRSTGGRLTTKQRGSVVGRPELWAAVGLRS